MLVYGIGYCFIFQYELRSFKELNHFNIQSGEISEPTIIKVNYYNGKVADKSVQLIDDNDEILYHGKLYDIVCAEVKGNTIIYSCISDEREDIISALANDHIQKQTNQGKGKKTNAISKTLSLFFEQQKLAEGSLNKPVITHFSFTSITILPVTYCNIPSPPPWNSQGLQNNSC
jgi:hypothetical protein